MRAVRMTAWQGEPEILDIPVPEPGPGQALVKVAGAGVCHSDLHIMEWPEGLLQYELPFTLGHEVTGWIERTGPGVRGWGEGEAVAVYGAWGCGRCHRCVQGMENYCEQTSAIKSSGGGLGLDGGMAEYMLVPSSRFLVPLGDLDPRTAAPLTDAGLTSYHAIKRSLHRLVPGSAALVIGVGGLGHMAVELLKALSPATVIAVDTAAGKRDLAKRLGADHVLTGGQDTALQVRDLTGGRGAELVLDFVGGQQTLALAAACASSLGEVAIVGMAGDELPVGVGRLPFECSVSVLYWGSRPELMEVIALAQQRRITPQVETFPLEQAPEVYRRLREGRLTGRAVLLPHG
ncbi:oxidoreductase [Planobispora rosea]|uniref:alcohol dehydrogenase n=1 Tax=Planobispora rosea TaxID=35762 RepID=A0A8J3WF09_PLARO|nr:NAD(P)-dependent alcohol dehydrogenase [Planobispora rosea]GGS71500.1 oxidoreductase [Planobispora rosea]GIH85486.1 oxidoreductase [Planobispora rosea]